MATLLTHKTESGHKKVCDSKCYNAQGPHCDCVCCGENHGKGELRAIKNSKKLSSALIKHYRRTHETKQLDFGI